MLPLLTVSLALTSSGARRGPIPRMLCMFFEPEHPGCRCAVSTAVDNAIRFVQQQAAPTDRVAVMTYGSQVNVLQDFTTDRDSVLAALRTIMPRPNAASAAPLVGLQNAFSMLSQLPEKKEMLYFSSGVSRDAVDPDQLRVTLDSAIRANVAIYPIGPNGVLPNSPAPARQ